MISDVITTIVARGAMLFIIMAWIIIHFGRKPRNGGSPPRDRDRSDGLCLLLISAMH